MKQPNQTHRTWPWEERCVMYSYLLLLAMCKMCIKVSLSLAGKDIDCIGKSSHCPLTGSHFIQVDIDKCVC